MKWHLLFFTQSLKSPTEETNPLQFDSYEKTQNEKSA